jgi:uncharacterized repeat protein (TIGR01451 family)
MALAAPAVAQSPPAGADLAVSIDSPGDFTPGTEASYTIALTNPGPLSALSVTLTHPLRAHTTFVSLAAPDGFSCTKPDVGATGTVTCSTSVLPPGMSTFTLVVKTKPNLRGLAVDASVASTGDPAGDNDSASESIRPFRVSPLTTSLTQVPAGPVLPGEPFSYVYTATNAGPSDVLSISIESEFASPFQYRDFTWTVPGDALIYCVTPGPGPTLHCDTAVSLSDPPDPVIPAGYTFIFELMERVATGTPPGPYTNNFAVFNHDLAPVTVVGPAADLQTQVTATPTPVDAGNQVEYTITTKNAGPHHALGFGISSPLPAGTTFVSLDAPAGLSCTAPPVGGGGTVACSDADFGLEETTVKVVAKVAPDLAAGSTLTFPATASTADSYDPASGNDTASASAPVRVAADLATFASGLPDRVFAGDAVTVRAKLRNDGPSVSRHASLRLPLPPGISLVTARRVEGPAFSCAEDSAGVTCTRETLGAGEETSIDLVLRTSRNLARGPLSLTARGSGAGDPSPANDEATLTATVPEDPNPPTSLELGDAKIGPRSGVIFQPIICENPLAGVCETTLAITFKPPHGRLKSIIRKVRLESGKYSRVLVVAPRSQRRRMKRFRRLSIVAAAPDPAGAVVTRESVLAGN